MTRHSVNNNTAMGLVISLCSNSNHLISLIPPPQTASNFRHLLSCGTNFALWIQIWPQNWDSFPTFAFCGNRTSQVFPLIWWTWLNRLMWFQTFNQTKDNCLELSSKDANWIFCWEKLPWYILRVPLWKWILCWDNFHQILVNLNTRFSSQPYNSTQKSSFIIWLNYWNVHPSSTLPVK